MWMWMWMWAFPESIGQMQSGTGMLNARAHSYTVRSYASQPIPRDRQPDTRSMCRRETRGHVAKEGNELPRPWQSRDAAASANAVERTESCKDS
ncbi:hypothetical protein V8C44DRAFT_241895 [Trichoderma aethiopicum]